MEGDTWQHVHKYCILSGALFVDSLVQRKKKKICLLSVGPFLEENFDKQCSTLDAQDLRHTHQKRRPMLLLPPTNDSNDSTQVFAAQMNSHCTSKVPYGAPLVNAFQAPILKSTSPAPQLGHVSATSTVTVFPAPPTPSLLPTFVARIWRPQ